MKKLVLTALMFAAVCTSTFAHDDLYFNNLAASDLKVKTLNGLKFRVTATNLLDQSVIAIKDKQGNTLYKESVAQFAFAKVFNLTSLPDGEYSFELSTGDQVYKEPFKISTEVTRVASPKK
ncbi:hypothetical protein LAG90_14410 [Marinilongibacter aquaticus]|uniref:hypothetical protein n=1 Tax=Marinilongibacter aquaticus TaxID=2975157 RepID=UPI0021BD4CC9|nr:hypothetical protein [Marinilongibacter aquaticus]UBM57998.1 hypothetical protein LAG90_14410 [Marinilongibacter aquaticus]